MGLLLVVGVLILCGVIALSAVAALVSTVLSGVLWLVFLPFRLIFFVFKLVFMALAGAVGLSLLLVAGIIAVVAFGLALLAPLPPILLVAGLVWVLARTLRRPARA